MASSLKTLKVSGLDIKPSKGSAFAIPTPANLPKLHQCCVVVGKRGSGKTTALVSLLEKLPFDYLIAVSPTMRSNADLMRRLPIEHVFEDVDDPGVCDNIRAILEAEAEALDKYREDVKKWKKLQAKLASTQTRITDQELDEFYSDRTMDLEPPTHRWGGRKPVVGVIFDDIQGSQLLSKPRKINQLVIFHRHMGQLAAGGSIGASLYFLVQSYKSHVGGLTRVIRNQTVSLVLFRTKNQRELLEIAEEMSGEIAPVTFLKVYERATREPHDFLLVDLHPKPNHPSQFRRNLNEFILAS